jgi:Spy/CpxP family protein refolding chaperone
MKRFLGIYLGLVAVAAVAVAAVAWAGEREARWRGHGLRKMGLKVYWSLLREDQKAPAKQILSDFLVATAPDHLHAAARLMEYKAQVAAILAPEQRREAWKAGKHWKGLSEDERRAIADRLLDGTDRSLLARRIEMAAGAAPEEQVLLGYQVLDQVYAVVEPELAKRLALTEDQRAKVRTAFDALKADLRPTAVTLARARAEAVRQALDLLDADQRSQVEAWKDDATAKVMEFLRGD